MIETRDNAISDSLEGNTEIHTCPLNVQLLQL